MLNNTKNYKNESCIDFEEIDTLLKKYLRVKNYIIQKSRHLVLTKYNIETRI